MRHRFQVFVALCLLSGCADPVEPADAGSDDGAGLEAGASDAIGDALGLDDGRAPVDAGVAFDGAALDGAVVDSGPMPSDSGFVDSGPMPDDSGLMPRDSGPDAGPPPANYTPLFSTRSAANGRDNTLENALIALVDAAVVGSRIRVAIYTFTRAAASSALIRAHERGVDVRVVLDGKNGSSAASELSVLRVGLGSARVTLCDAPGSACVGSGIMHHKTLLFSELADGSRNVVVQGSHNLTNGQLSMHNNMLVIRNDAALFAAHERTWEDLRADIEIPNYYRIDDGSLATRAYFYPRVGGDTAVSFLDNVTCDSGATIRVAMAFFTNARVAVAESLARRQREGCNVRVVIGDAEIRAGSRVLSTLRAAGVDVTLYPERSGGWGLHSKYLLIDARYAASAGHRRLVFTGSHNWTGPALSINDETLLRVEDSGVFDAYAADWARVRAAAGAP